MSKSVKEVCELTGFTRKMLFDYEREGIVKASDRSTRGYTNAAGQDYRGYKVYDDDAVMKLQIASLYRKIGLERAEIKEIITADDFDCLRILDEQIELLNNKKKELENQILLAEQLKWMGIKNKFAPLYMQMDLSILSENIQRWNNSEYYKELEKKLLQEDVYERYQVEGNKILEELLALDESEYETQLAKDILTRLFKLSTQELNLFGLIFLMGFAIGGTGDGEIGKEISDEDGERLPEKLADLIMANLVEYIFEAVGAYADKLSLYKEINEMEFEDKRVKELVDVADAVLHDYFGVAHYTEYEVLEEGLNWIETLIGKELDPIFRYSMKAIKYYKRLGLEEEY